MTLNLRIREIRKERGKTLSEVAAVVGISVPHLSEVERGIKNLNNHLLTRISAALEVEPQELISGSDDPQALELALLMEALDEADQERVRSFARALADSRRARGPAA